jgi:acetoin utilization deacetylase AcuC-like enzyme
MTKFFAYSSSSYTVELPGGHAFPMFKYEAVRQNLLDDGTLQGIYDPMRPDWSLVERIHHDSYLKKLRFGTLTPREERLLGFPWSLGLIERALRAAGGTLQAAQDAIAGRGGVHLGINLAGGTHHAYADHGEGFCVLNDVAITSAELLHQQVVQRIAVLDLDVHQGNGTAAIFADEPRVLTISVHGERNYPWRKEQSDVDVGLADGIGDDEYLQLLQQKLLPILDTFSPDIVFYIAGVDVLHNDRFGRFALSLNGAFERDKAVFSWAKYQSVPIVSLMGGGYNRDRQHTVLGHGNTVRAACSVFR